MADDKAAAPVADDDDDAPVVVADKPREPTEYERQLRRESAKYRRQAREAAERVATRETELKAEHAAALAAANSVASERLIRAELKAAAKAAGMVDLDGLKLLDTSGVTMDAAGQVVLPDKFFDTAKAAKPYLFAAPTSGTETGNTASTATVPTTDPAPKHATTMTDAEFKAGLSKLGVRI